VMKISGTIVFPILTKLLNKAIYESLWLRKEPPLQALLVEILFPTSNYNQLRQRINPAILRRI